jgi:hypothetical protein
MEPSPSLEASKSSASKEFFRILSKPKVLYRINHSLPPVPALCHIEPAHIPSHFIKIRFNTRWFKYDRDKLSLVYSQIVPVIFEPPCIIHPSTLRSSKWPPSLRFHHQSPACTSSTYMLHALLNSVFISSPQ